MKKIKCLYLFLILYNCSVEDNSNDLHSYSGDVYLTSQQEINEFSTNQYEKILGSLTISDTASDLTALSDLKIIDGYLRITSCNNIESLNGLNNLRRVTQTIWIEENSSLTDISALNNINSNCNSLEIYDNDLLTSLEGLNNVRFESFIIILENYSLTDFCAISNSINGTFSEDSGNYQVNYNAFNPTQDNFLNGYCSQ
ncbi:hypothetical protein KO504_03095 [Winogradskyella psychrotolerans]|uniref:hypothetical protein n=1 Tax=Winogradskyella psychrotolerans TaxID=1344585 RepID=UPI001C0722B1|nr:hypothetical protein [Winogradskyella psychrotolerans]MBU2920313.1 hypothetical protein [Winogradskyella psychrotolerans]